MSWLDDLELGAAGAFDALRNATADAFGETVAAVLFTTTGGVIVDVDGDGRRADDVYAEQTREAAVDAGADPATADALAELANEGADAAEDAGALGEAWKTTKRRVRDGIANPVGDTFDVLAWLLANAGKILAVVVGLVVVIVLAQVWILSSTVRRAAEGGARGDS